MMSPAEAPLPLHNATSRHVDVTAYEAEFTRMMGALRRAQSALAASRPGPEEVVRLSAELEEIAIRAEAARVMEPERVAGRLWEVTGRAQTLVPPVIYDARGDEDTHGTVTFGAFHLGNGAAHGGAISLVFDEIMGRTVIVSGLPDARTASLKVDYRRLVPVETPLRFDAWIASREGRKIILRATLSDEAGAVLSEAEALFIVVRDPISW